MQILDKVDDSDGQREYSLHDLRIPGPILQIDEAGLQRKLLNIEQEHMPDIVVEGEPLADLALLLNPVALGYLVYVLNLKGRVGVVGEEDLQADLGVYLLEDVAGHEKGRTGEDCEGVLETVPPEFGEFRKGLKVGEVGIQGVLFGKGDLLSRHELLPLLLVGGELG